jgi:hypothetical protein
MMVVLAWAWGLREDQGTRSDFFHFKTQPTSSCKHTVTCTWHSHSYTGYNTRNQLSPPFSPETRKTSHSQYQPAVLVQVCCLTRSKMSSIPKALKVRY